MAVVDGAFGSFVNSRILGRGHGFVFPNNGKMNYVFLASSYTLGLPLRVLEVIMDKFGGGKKFIPKGDADSCEADKAPASSPAKC